MSQFVGIGVEIRRSTGILCCLFGGLAACAGGDGPAGEPVVQDSSGIRIVDNTAPSWTAGEAWQVGVAGPGIGAGEDAPGQQLHHVSGALRLGDGTIVIANGGSGELRRYGPDGAFLGAAGRAGSGPGEFRSLAWVGRTAGDSLLAWDRGLNRMTVFTSAGEYVRDYQVALPENPTSQVMHGSLSGGRILFSRGASFVAVAGVAGLQRQPLTAWLVLAAGELATEFGPFPGESVYLRPGRQTGSTIRTPVPFGAATVIAAGGEYVHVADNGGYDVRTYDASGRLVRIVRRPHEPLPLRPEDIAADIERRLEPLPPVPEIRAGSRASLEMVPKPAFVPPLRSMLVDAEGCLWIEAGRRPDRTDATWSIFDPEGVWLGDLTMAAGMEPLDIGTDYMLVRALDEFDVETVRLFDLRRGPATR